jgi:hypothetical protein
MVHALNEYINDKKNPFFPVTIRVIRVPNKQIQNAKIKTALLSYGMSGKYSMHHF